MVRRTPSPAPLLVLLALAASAPGQLLDHGDPGTLPLLSEVLGGDGSSVGSFEPPSDTAPPPPLGIPMGPPPPLGIPMGPPPPTYPWELGGDPAAPGAPPPPLVQASGRSEIWVHLGIGATTVQIEELGRLPPVEEVRRRLETAWPALRQVPTWSLPNNLDLTWEHLRDGTFQAQAREVVELSGNPRTRL